MLVAFQSAACMAPGGGVQGHVLADTGDAISGAQVEVDFGDGASFDMKSGGTGEFMTVWSHGSWTGPLVRASAPGRQTAEAAIGWDGWTCQFSLAPVDAQPGSSKAQCSKNKGE